MGEQRAAVRHSSPGLESGYLKAGFCARSAIAATWRPEEETPYAGLAWPVHRGVQRGSRAASRSVGAERSPPIPCGTCGTCIPGSGAEESKKNSCNAGKTNPTRDALRPWLGGPVRRGVA
ncbi:hypothetical protein NDU88_000541 [Pleurodeles waltl]|uniref:Uncharacterized protein n=1 Tax=Pleurodeles waltl TaxID=8319 RepID=A0AAV7UQA3_PLEWA|nr:hypothetical protein NDU88_000541 [Pleurodeles waltl]